MIGYLRGRVNHKQADRIILDVQGVGYSVGISLSTYLSVGNVGNEVELSVYTHVTDNSMALYGFSSEAEKETFLKLISISGIGPKIALNILSGIGVSDLEEAIRNSDVDRISLVPGIGKKTAMRIALELQEKLIEKEKIFRTGMSQEREDLLSALLNMGFKRKEVEKIVDATIKDLKDEAEFEALLRESLRQLARL
ncbi:MAG: Holliday junction branch migration protein RuvA [Candidatus Aminicenantaceae bacterium]